jgi:UDP-3-O-[3-hydroxymyristoyl] N-acetylglucosamine deacetylase
MSRSGASETGETGVEGVGLHSGAPSRVVLRQRPGPVALEADGVEASIDQLEIVSTVRSTTVEARGGALRVATVEHAFAALGGLGVYEGLSLAVYGPEMPLLDGGAATWCEAVQRLGVRCGRPRLRVGHAGHIEVGASRYEFAPGDRVEVEVRIELEGFDEKRVVPEARWHGDAADFRLRIAPARTFTLSRDVGELAALGLARHVDRESVVVLTPPDVTLHAGRAFSPDEPARHKLLDLVGDLYLHGGPPRGRLRAVRPGHAANALAVRRALLEGILVAEEC